MRRLLMRLAVAVLAGLLIYVAFTDPRGRWRFQALVHKAVGFIPELSWFEAIVGVTPVTLRRHLRPTLSLVAKKAQDGDPLCPVRWSTPVGDFWGREGDRWLIDRLVREQWIERVYDYPDARVEPGDIVFDVGAHLGSFTRYALMHGAARVVAIEPEPVNATCFAKTFASEIHDGSVALLRAAAWEKAGLERFALDAAANDSGGGRIVEGGAQSVETVTLDAVAERLALRRVDFVKLNVQGAESEALRGADRILARQAPRMALWIGKWSDDAADVIAEVRRLRGDYEAAMIRSQLFFF